MGKVKTLYMEKQAELQELKRVLTEEYLDKEEYDKTIKRLNELKGAINL